MKLLVFPGPALLLTSDNIKQRLGSAALDRYLPSLLLRKNAERYYAGLINIQSLGIKSCVLTYIMLSHQVV